MMNPYELVIVPYDEYINRIRPANHHDNHYDFTHHGYPGVKLTDALGFKRGSYSMDNGDTLMTYHGAKFEYRLTLTGRTSRHSQYHAKCMIGGRVTTNPLWRAAMQAARFVSKDLKVEPLFAPDGRQLHLDDLYLLQLHQQGASLLVVLAYYNVPPTNIAIAPAPPIAQPSQPSPPSPPPPPSSITIPMSWQPETTPSYMLESTLQSPQPQLLTWNGYPSASVPRSMYGPSMMTVADPGLHSAALPASSTSYSNSFASQSYDEPHYSLVESHYDGQPSSLAGYPLGRWSTQQVPDNRAGPSSYSYAL